MEEIVVNLHMHTLYSDGSGTHQEVAKAAIQAGLDAILITDHNVRVEGFEGYYEEGGKRVLALVGEEVHDQARQPQKNHLLVFGAEKEMATYAQKPQVLLDQARRAGGLTFLAHPNESALAAIGEPDITWEEWPIRDFTGIELWNGFSELKSVAKSRLQLLYYAFNPRQIAHGPLPETLALWDRLIAGGQKVVAVGGSDAHAIPYRVGPWRKVIFPYAFHFQAVNTHLLLPQALQGLYEPDKAQILAALAAGHGFVANDQLASSRGFRFNARGREDVGIQGDALSARGGITFQIHLPPQAERGLPGECRLLKDGQVLKTWHKRDDIIHNVSAAGVYRVEVYLNPRGGRRGWIFSNPIYIRE